MNAYSGTNIIDIQSRTPSEEGFKPLDLKKTYQIARGAPIIPETLAQPVKNRSELLTLAKAEDPHFVNDMREIAQRFHVQFKHPGVKSAERIDQKVTAEKGDIRQIFDAVRGTLMVDRPSKIVKLMDFFAMDLNSSVAHTLDQFAVPDAETGLRRAKLILRRPSGFLTELQIMSKPMETALTKSHRVYESQRSIDALLNSTTSCLALEAYNCLSRRATDLGQQRKQINEAGARNAGLDALVEDRAFMIINDIPFAAITRRQDIAPTLLRPDPATGRYVVDNSVFSEYERGNFMPICRDSFLRASYDIAKEGKSHLPVTGTNGASIHDMSLARNFG